MLGNLEAKSVGAKVRNLAKEIDRSFGIAAFEFAICGAHAAKGLKLAGGADGLARARGLANVLEAALPATSETAIANVGPILMGEDANGHLALRVDSAAVLASAAGIFLGALGAESAS